MKPAVYNILGEKVGSRFVLPLLLCDDEEGTIRSDLTGYTAALRVRYTADSLNLLLEATTESGGILLPAAGEFNLIADCVLDISPGKFVYDLAVYDPLGYEWPVLTGRFEPEASTL